MGNANSTSNISTNHQPNIQAGYSKQVRTGDGRHQSQPSPPPRSSSFFLPTLRRRATEPMPPSHRQRYAQRPGETHTRYTYGFSRTHGRSGYTFGFRQRGNECSDDDGEYAQHRQTVRSSNKPTEGNLNGERCECSQTLTDAHAHSTLDNACGHSVRDSQGNTQRDVGTRGHEGRRTRSRTLDDLHDHESNSYTENIRAMAEQMYGDSPTHSKIPTRGQSNRNTHRSADSYVDAHSHNCIHNQSLTRRYFQLWPSLKCVDDLMHTEKI